MYHSIIGEGSANAGTYKVHGNPLGESDGAYAKVIINIRILPLKFQRRYMTFLKTPLSLAD